ncbi:DUF4124 domain-containing protein [Microbulbifer marinus]|uniref:DUF4124 domain-containing protein n=1 Tax=Microbulbifer marinus TaxID=658218 RepID=A0A1H3YSI4_9GAMM|nr:DUF4124 domain-containing protein [Microbulbifer marinus]SEA14410.1 protein of unknown function [Microbulbifer marinus]
MKSLCGGLLLSVLLLASATALAADLYRWVDEDGKVHFGDRPPMEAKAENIEGELRPINSADAPPPQQTASRQQHNPEQEYEQRQRQRELRQQQRLTRACNAARRQLRLLQGRVAFVDDSGKEVKMSERERQQRAEQLQREIQRVCG